MLLSLVKFAFYMSVMLLSLMAFCSCFRDSQGAGIDVCLNSISGKFIPESLSCMAKQGSRFIEIGKAGIWSPEQVQAFRPDVWYKAFDLMEVSKQDVGVMHKMMSDIAAEFEKHVYTPLPYHRFPLSDVRSAFRFMAQVSTCAVFVFCFSRMHT